MRYLRTLRYIDAVARAGSIRKAAEHLALTASSLNRRIQDFEEELGTPVFERLPRGVRLNAAGELLIRHARAQMADLERVRSQIADLSGVRRGRVSIACSQAVAHHLLPEAISTYRTEFPYVIFEVWVRDHVGAQQALVDFTADMVLVFEPAVQVEKQTHFVLEQPLHAIMDADHPLAAKEVVRLRECLRYPLVMPDRGLGARKIIDEALGRRSLTLEPVIESNSFEFLREYVRREQAITFQIAIGAATEGHSGLVSRLVDPRDAPPGKLVLGYLRGRTLPVAAAKFADQLAKYLDLLGGPQTPDLTL